MPWWFYNNFPLAPVQDGSKSLFRLLPSGEAAAATQSRKHKSPERALVPTRTAFSGSYAPFLHRQLHGLPLGEQLGKFRPPQLSGPGSLHGGKRLKVWGRPLPLEIGRSHVRPRLRPRVRRVARGLASRPLAVGHVLDNTSSGSQHNTATYCRVTSHARSPIGAQRAFINPADPEGSFASMLTVTVSGSCALPGISRQKSPTINGTPKTWLT